MGLDGEYDRRISVPPTGQHGGQCQPDNPSVRIFTRKDKKRSSSKQSTGTIRLRGGNLQSITEEIALDPRALPAVPPPAALVGDRNHRGQDNKALVYDCKQEPTTRRVVQKGQPPEPGQATDSRQNPKRRPPSGGIHV